MTIKTHTRLSREELHDLIWSKPTAKLANEFGVSDVAIAKWCKKMEIPKPPRGYWAKKRVGKNVPNKPRLKALSKKGVEIIEYYHDSEAAKNEKVNPRDIEVIPGSLDTPHKLVSSSLKALRKGRPWGVRNIIYSQNKRVLDIQVTASSIDRACTIFDSLVKTLEHEGIKVYIDTSGESTKTIAEVEGEQIQIGIDEKTKRIENKPAPGKKGKRSNVFSGYPQYEYHPTGRLSLIVRSWGTYGIRSEWKDGKIQRIENLIQSTINSLELIAIKWKNDELERIEKEKQDRIRKEIERKEMIKAKKCEIIIEHMELWQKANYLKAYLNALKSKKNTTPKINEYIALGLEHASRLDPLLWPSMEFSFDEEKIRRELPYSYW